MIKPFADDDAASSIGGLSVENGTARLVLSGSIEITRDQTGLAKARELKLLFDRIVGELEAAQPLQSTEPSKVASVDRIANPFA